MSRVFDGDVLNFLQLDDEVVTDWPYSICAWVKINAIGTSESFIGYAQSPARRMHIRVVASGVVEHLTKLESANTSSNQATTGTISAVTWALVVARGDNGRADPIVIDIDSESAAFTTGTVASIVSSSSPKFVIGQSATSGSPFGGKVAHVAIWTEYLSDASVAELMSGVAPDSITAGSANLFDYWPLTDASLIGTNGNTLVVNGTVASDGADNPAVGTTDTTSPVITILGSTPINHPSGTVYSDAGATAADNIDGDITGNIITTNNVTDRIETTNVLYNVSDAAGNPASQATRAVNVIAPTGYTKTDASATPIIAAGYLAFNYTGTAPTIGGQYVFEQVTVEDGHTIAVDADGLVRIVGTPPVATQTFSFYFVDASGIAGASAVFTYNVDASVAPTLPADQAVDVVEGTTVVNNTSTATAGTAPITYSHSGTDQASFTIDQNTGTLTFAPAPDFETKTNYSVTVTGINAFGNDSQIITITITNVNEQVIDDGNNASEEFPNGDAGLPKTSPLFTNWLALFTNATGNNSDSLPATLTVAGSPYSVTFTLNDADDLIRTFTVTEQAQVTPTDITLSSTSVSVSGGVNAVVGTLTTTDANINDIHIYTLVAGTGDADISSFGISSNQLTCNDPAALGLGTYSIRVQTSDGTNTYQEAFTISVVAAGVASAGHQNITANDAVVYTNMVGLYVGGSGNVVAEINGVEATYYAVPTGTILPGYFSVIKASTTATNLVALFG